MLSQMPDDLLNWKQVSGTGFHTIPIVVTACLISSDVAAHGAEGLREGAHQNINISWVNAPVVSHTTSTTAKSADAVSLVNVEVSLH